jgi:hypothetical protein
MRDVQTHINTTRIETYMTRKSTMLIDNKIQCSEMRELTLCENSLFCNIGDFHIEAIYSTMDSEPTTLFEDNLERLINLGYIRIHEDEDKNQTMTMSPEGKQWVEDNGK